MQFPFVLTALVASVVASPNPAPQFGNVPACAQAGMAGLTSAMMGGGAKTAGCDGLASMMSPKCLCPTLKTAATDMLKGCQGAEKESLSKRLNDRCKGQPGFPM